MRLKEDDTSWKASGVKRRDFRSVKNGPETSSKPRKKSTKLWCKGVVGRAHSSNVRLSHHGEWRLIVNPGISPCRKDWGSNWNYLDSWHEEFCTACGKVLKFGLGDDCPFA